MATHYDLYVQAVGAYASHLDKTAKPVSADALRLITDAHVLATKHQLHFDHTSCRCSSVSDVAKLLRRAFDVTNHNQNAAEFMTSTGFLLLDTHLRPLVESDDEWTATAQDIIRAAFPVIHAHDAQQAFETRFPTTPHRFIQPDVFEPRVRPTSPRKPRTRRQRHALKPEGAGGPAGQQEAAR